MHRLAELIHRRHLLHTISRQLHHLQITCQTGHLTGNIYNLIHPIIQDLRECLRMDSVSRRIQYDHIRLLFNLIKHFKHIACNEFTIGKPISDSIFFCRLDCFFNNLNTDHFLRNRSKYLTNCSCSAEQIKHNLIIDISDIFSYCLIKYFCPFGVRLKE